MKRKFWAFLRMLPQGLRANYLRRQFEVTACLPENLILKQAETEDEIRQALHIVYESYLSLNYIDPNSAELRMTKYQLLPTTIILIAKNQNEVIGTLSIIMDSSLKLPSDACWDLSEYEYCKTLLKLDGIVASTAVDVEPFYTDLLMFKRISKKLCARI